jgi:hypothetical protein
MYKVMTITNNIARVHKRTKDIVKAQEIMRELREQGIRTYCIKKEK